MKAVAMVPLDEIEAALRACDALRNAIIESHAVTKKAARHEAIDKVMGLHQPMYEARFRLLRRFQDDRAE